MRKKSSHSSGPSVHNVIGGGETATSTDGKTWTTHDYNDLHLPYPYDLHAITWSKDLKLFVAVGGAGSYDFIGTSSNGRSWVKQHPPVSHGLSGIAWSGSQFVAVGGNTILTSSDGRNWVEQGVDVADPDTLYGVTSSGSQFVAVGVTPESSGIILTSYDRKTWVKQNSPSSSDLTGVAWSGSQFVAVGLGGTILTWP